MNSSKSKLIMIDLSVGDQLTTISCGHVVVELIKFIAYQRLQIPYTYQWLKQVVNKKKMCEERIESFNSERHFHVASTALENLDFILKSLLQEINSTSIPEEVCIALGASPVTCKEVYRLLLPTTCHTPQCHSAHIATDQKIRTNVFKALVTSDKLSQVFLNPLPPTNTYVFLRKRVKNSPDVLNNDNFVAASGYRIPRSSRIVVIDFRSQLQDNMSCCNKFEVFDDGFSNNLVSLQIDDESDKTYDEYREIESTNEMKWYQSAYVMKGFKDCIVNGNSVTNKWLES